MKATQTKEKKRVGDIRHRALALLMSVLLTITCLPIVPGSMKEVHAETVPTSVYTHDGYITSLYISHTSGVGTSTVRVGYTYKGTDHTIATNTPIGACTVAGSTTLTGFRINGVVNPTITMTGNENDGSGSLSWPYYNQSLSASVGGAGGFSDSQVANGSLASLRINCNIAVERVTTTNQTYPPTITAPNYENVLGGPAPQYNYTEGVIGRYGYTTSKTFGNGNSTNGTITWTTGTTALTSDMLTFNRIGVEPHSYLATDTSDNTRVTGSRLVISKLGYALNLEGEFDSGSNAGNPYGTLDPALEEGWTNEDVKVTTEIPPFNSLPVQGSYLLTLRSGGSSNSGNSDTYSHVINTDFNGSSVATLTGSAPSYTNIELASPETMPVKVDKTNPIADATASVSGYTVSITDASSDAFSGLSALLVNATKYALVDAGVTPTDSDYTSSTSITAPGTGAYDLWVWAKDKATNETKARASGGGIVITSSASATIDGATAGPDTTDVPLASGTWTNQNVKVTVTPPVPDIGGNYYSALYEVFPMPGQTTKGTILKDPVDHTYTQETASTIVEGVMVDAADTFLSGVSAQYEVKIDTTRPVGDVTFNAGIPDYGFTDTSTDTASLVGANSGVDAAKTVIAIVPHGDPQPATSDYSALAGEELPATGYYDVWVIATDTAGNKSIPVMALEHITRSSIDEIKAKDFSYDIAHGASSLDDAMAKMLSHVEGKPYGSGTPFDVTTEISVDATERTAIQAAITAGQKGTTWPLTFSTPAGSTQASTTIQVTLFDNGSTPDIPPGPLTHEMIYANNFTWGISTGALSSDQSKISSQVTAYDTNGDLIATSALDVGAGELAAINGAISSGQKDTSWPLTYYTPDSTAVTIQVTLYDNGPPIAPQVGDEMVVGNNFKWGISSGSIADAQALFLANAQATSATGTPMAQSSIAVDAAELGAINAAIASSAQGTIWPLTFTTDGSSGTAASTTVMVTLYDAGPPVVNSGDEHIVGNNFNWGISTGSLDDAAALVLSQAYGTSGQGTQLPTAGLLVDATELAAINAAIAANDIGSIWPLTLSTDGSTGTAASAVVYVTLYDNGPSIPPSAGDEHIVGNNFNWGISTGTLDITSAQVLSKVAGTGALGTPLALSQIATDATELAAINGAISAGQKDTSWPLTFTTDGSTGTPASVTIQVTLYDNGPVAPPTPGDEHIVGNNFNWGISSGSIADAQALFLANAQATSATGIPMAQSSIAVDVTELGDINAAIASSARGTIWPLTFTTDGSSGTAASTTVMVTLYDTGHLAPVPGDPYIVANHFSHPVDGGALSDDDTKVKSLVAALAFDGTVGALSDIAVDATHLAAINTAIAARDTSSVLPLCFTYTCPYTGRPATTTVQVNLTGSSDLEITKTVDSASPLPGDTITYTITVKNNGVATAQGLWIKDNLPAATIFVSCDAKGIYGATLSGQEYVHWYIAKLAVGQEETFTVKVKIDNCTPGTVIKNVALYEEGALGLPANLDDDPQGGETEPAISTVADNSKVSPTKRLPITGDTIFSFIVLGIVALVALGAIGYSRRKNRKDH